MSEESKESHHHHHHHHHQFLRHHHGGEDQPPPSSPPEYGTFEAPSQPVIGFPQPVPPPGVSGQAPPEYYAHGYQAVPGYIAPDPEGRPHEREHHHLPCCGIGLGWFMFIVGFLLAGIPWYLAAFVLLCAQIDPREKPGYIVCTIAAVLATFVLVFGLSKT